jgi:cellulose synthase (UDP-forming)
LVPEEFGSFCKQQLKWSRGVFEVTFVEIPKLFTKLTFWQKLSYLLIGSYYLVGVTAFFFTLVPFLFFLTGILPANMSFVEFVINGSIVAIISVIIYLFVQRWLSHRATERGLHWRGMILKFASWPVFLLGFLLAVVNEEIPYIPTAKKAVTGYFTPFARPLILQVALFIIAVVIIFIQRRFFIPESELILSAEKTWAMIGFAFIAFVMSFGGIIAAWKGRNIKVEDPWDTVDLNCIKYQKNDKKNK